MPIRTVFFDMGGTIDTYWHTPAMRLGETPGLQRLLASNGINLHLTDQQLYELVTNGLARYHRWRLASLDEIPPSQVWREYILTDYPEKFPQLDAIADDLMVWLETHYSHRQMRPEMPAVLDALQRMGLKIGLISNVNSYGQVPKNLMQYGIRGYFDPVVLSSEYRRRKPDPAIFHHAARLSCTPASECIYIGDRISRDILGAKRAGFRMAIQIRHDFQHGETDEGAVPDFILNNMTELLDVIKNEGREVNSAQEEEASQQLRAVLFDAEGVLYYRKNRGHEYRRLFKELGLKNKAVPEVEKEHYRRQASIGLITFEQYKQKVLQMLGITEPAQIARGIQIAQEEHENVHYFRGVRNTLKSLKNKRLYLGVVTDTAHPLYVKIRKLEGGGFGDLWDSIISSREVGVQKPDAVIYELALKQLGIRAEQAVFVGHNADELKGARDIGMKTIAFNQEPGARADHYIRKFSDLIDLVVDN